MAERHSLLQSFVTAGQISLGPHFPTPSFDVACKFQIVASALDAPRT